MDKWAITTSKARGKHGYGLTTQALQLSRELQIPVLERQNRGIPRLLEQYGLDCLLVEEEKELAAHWPDGMHLAFHPGMAVQRIRQIKDHKVEMLTHVTGVRPGDTILDCTMGLAGDAIVLAYAAGDTGKVTALESSPLIYAITSYGLNRWDTGSWRMHQAMRRIEPHCCDYRDYLQQLAEGAYDIVYLDPMFERPVLRSSGIAPLRREANHAPLTEEMLQLASRAARRRVVVKHRAGTLQHLQFDQVQGGTYSALAYGLIMTDRKGV